MKLKGALKRARLEYRYVTMGYWGFKDVGDFWDTVHDYDEIDDETYAYKRRFTDSLRMCSIKKASRVLDIDCRTGNGSVFFHRHGLLKETVCITPSPMFRSVCQKRLAKHKVPGKTLLLRKLPLQLKAKSFDAVLCFETVEHISNHVPFLKELNRLLKDDGELIVTMPNILWEPVHWLAAILAIHHSEGPHRFLRRRAIIGFLKKAGFQIRREETTVLIPSGPRWLTRFGEQLESAFKTTLMPWLGLRRIFICKKE
jgi:2-polyprenyl-3-methyl-5-hydroxy-6-metoxy-1,4-benzoquinol methylase